MISTNCQGRIHSVSPRPSPRRAFTVPEMLAVVAIIMIVLSILLPNLGQAREIARETVCQSNMHQIGLASRNYSTETKYLPSGWDPGGYNAQFNVTFPASIVWVPMIYPYMGRDPKIFYCPSAPRQAVWDGIKTGGTLPGTYGYRDNDIRIGLNEFFSYGHNNDGSNVGLHVGVGETTHGLWIRAASVKAPSAFIMYGDSTVDTLWDHFIDEDYEDGAGRTEYPADRHRGGAFLAFGDGHVEWDLQRNLIHLGPFGTALPEQRRRWNNDNLPH